MSQLIQQTKPTATILIAEDQQDILENLSEFLTLCGYHCLQANDGKKAYALALEHHPDLIISDLGMPVWDGHALLREMQNHPCLSRTPLIILTAWADRENMRKGLEEGAVDYITKPFTLAEIEQAVAKHLERKKRTDNANLAFAMEELIPSLLKYLPHELRTPINGILAPSEILLEIGNSTRNQEITDFAGMIHQSALNMQRVIENITWFLSLQKSLRQNADGVPWPSPEPQRPQVMFDQASEKILQQQEFPSARMHVEGAIEGDWRAPGNLAKIFEELLDNACKFAAPETPVTVSWTQCGNHGIFSITNEGPGMEREEIDAMHVFRQHDRVLTEQQGLGLGLFIANQIAARCLCELEITSSKAGPTCVTLRFPLSKATAD